MLYNDVRPVTFDEVMGQDMVRESLRSQSIAGNFFGLYIFCGQFGGGKTTMARIAALAANCSHKDEKGNPCLSCPSCKAILESSTPDIVEIDGASNNGVDKVRDLIASVDYRPITLRKKVIIIDEVHMLSKAAFNALLKTLEEPPSYAIFILCTTDEDAIPATVKSRAAVYRFRSISESVIEERLRTVADNKNIRCEGESIALLARYANGSMRNALSLLEQAALSGTVTSDGVTHLVGARSSKGCFELLEAVLSGNVSAVSKKCAEFSVGACDHLAITDDCLSVISDAVMYQYDTECVKGTASYKAGLSSLLAVADSERLLHLSEVLLDLKGELKKTHGASSVFLLRLALFCKDEDRIAKLEMKVLQLEEKIKNIGSGSVEEKTVVLTTPEPVKPSVSEVSAGSDCDGFEDAADEELNLFSDEKNDFDALINASISPVSACEVSEEKEEEKKETVPDTSDDVPDISSLLFGGKSFFL